ncbi:PDZ domain-containing protein GIPC1 [Habropoda laboriosa]|uniref:PDZ domain-containing protein GIPC1 n=1 Tax=Habropoda laboriosa TaxID=597456 RepID=A0A0L7QSM0_9HYME|nr:PDZ domain-containing protein GIPC1 [Habropoda laboriosa]
MPLFKARAAPRSPTSEKKSVNGVTHYNSNHNQQNGTENDQEGSEGTRDQQQNGGQEQRRSSRVSRPPLVFHCQLAHGSSTGLISGFSNVRELYQKIAECYDLPMEESGQIFFRLVRRYSMETELSIGRASRIQETLVPGRGLILFCTLNTHKLEMNELLGSQIGVGDFIFAHKKGRPKEIELVKTDDALGLTITDNGAGYAFIKRIKEGSVINRIKVIEVGDHLEKINSTSLIGKRHFEVANLLKDIPKGATFTLRLVEPLKNGFASIGPRWDMKKGKKSGYGTGKETLRFKADGSAQIVEKMDDVTTVGINKINVIMESFMGIYDTELATQIWELSEDKWNSMEFAEAMDNSELEDFGFTNDFVMELWDAITDARAGKRR